MKWIRKSEKLYSIQLESFYSSLLIRFIINPKLINQSIHYFQMKQQQSIPPQNSTHLQKIIEHPALYYGTSQVYSIRKQSINTSNDLIYKKLSKQFQRIKKLRADNNGNTLLSAQYDYDSSLIKRDFRRLHDNYNICTKANVIVKRRIDKMRNKVDHIKSEVERDELNSVKQVDINKILSKGAQTSLSSNGANLTAKSKN